MKLLALLLTLGLVAVCKAAIPQLRFAWKEVEYVWDTPADKENAIKDGIYVPANNVPVGVARWKNKLFVTVPRWKNGVASSLNYIDIDGTQDQPLKPYPSMKDNLVPDTAKELPSNKSIISAFRIFVDECDRLWVMDTGSADMFGILKTVVTPSIAIFDLNTDKLVRRYFFKNDDYKEENFFANIVVDVDKDKCDNAFAYATDISSSAVVVYSLEQNDSWRVTHHYFHMDPLAGTFNANGMEFYWADGVLGLALSEPKENGFKTMFFHPFTSTKEFYVSTDILRNFTLFGVNEVFNEFKLLGDRGEFSQSSSSYYDTKTNVLFYTQANKNGVGCWNSKKPFTLENNPFAIRDPELLEFPVDLKVDSDGLLWVMSDKLPQYFYEKLDPDQINHIITSISTIDAIEGTTCE